MKRRIPKSNPDDPSITYNIGRHKFGPVQRSDVSVNYPTPQPCGPWEQYAEVVSVMAEAMRLRTRPGKKAQDDWRPGRDVGAPEIIQAGLRAKSYLEVYEHVSQSKTGTTVLQGAMARAKQLAESIYDRPDNELVDALAASGLVDTELMAATAYALALRSGQCDVPVVSS